MHAYSFTSLNTAYVDNIQRTEKPLLNFADQKSSDHFEKCIVKHNGALVFCV